MRFCGFQLRATILYKGFKIYTFEITDSSPKDQLIKSHIHAPTLCLRGM